MKRPLALTFLLVVGFLVGPVRAQLAPLPDGARFDTPTTFVTEAQGESLRAMIDALARTAGLTPIVDGVPDTAITFNIDEAKPFRQVWAVVLTQYGLDYALLENDVIVVGPPAAIAGFRPGEPVQVMAVTEALTRFYRVNNAPADVATIVRQAVPGVTVTVLESVRSISVQGSLEQHEQVQDLLSQFDQAAGTAPSVVRTYRLNNARAEDLAAILQGADLTVRTQEAGEAGAFSTTEARNYTVVADERTNTLIVTATADVQAQLAQLIPGLDVPQQQVNVQVRIQEIQTRVANNLGINLSAGLGNFATTILGGSLGFIFDAQRAISGLNIGAVLDTLESQGLSRRVDDSNMTVLNNGTASMKSGGRIEITFEGTNGEISARTIEFGVIINVRPRISADGRIILEVSAEVSDLLTPFSEGGIPQRIDFSERTVSSTITLQPGQTVLMGGLLQNQFTTSESGVPVLSSLPLVGSLFKTTTASNTTTDLLLIVTADVLQ